MFCLGVVHGVALTMFLSLLGVGFGANMFRLAVAPERDGRWWPAQHMNGATLNCIATHDSFIAPGLGSVVPEIRHSVPRMLVAAGVSVTGVLLRIWLGRRHVRAGRDQHRLSPALTSRTS